MQKLLHLNRYILGSIFTILVVMIAVVVLFHGSAKAGGLGGYISPYCDFTILGRQGCDGYFSNQNFYDDPTDPVPGNGILPQWPSNPTSSADVFPAANTPAAFEAEFASYLAQTNNATVYNYGSVGAAFIIDAMLGESGPAVCEWYTGSATTTTCTWQAGVAYAIANLPQWDTDVSYYAAQGWITWDQVITYPTGTPDSAHVCYSGQASCIRASVGTHDPGDPEDIAIRADPQVYVFNSLIFHNPNGTVFEISRTCGNVAGEFKPLVPPPTATPVTCGNATPSQSLLQSGDLFSVTLNASFPSGPPPTFTNFTVSIPSVPYSNNGAVPTVSGQTITYTTSSLRAPPAGTYPISWQLFNGATALTPVCTGTLSVNDLPYFSAYGADVRAGGDFTPGCQTGSGTTGGTLGGWYDNQTAVAGAHALFGAIAIGQITGFGSAQGITAGPNTQPMGLTYANAGPGAGGSTSSATLPQMGGDYGAAHCFYSPTQPGSTVADITNPATIGSATLTTGAHSYSAVSQNLNLTGGTVGLGDSLGIYVTGGSVYISPNGVTNVNGIEYNTAGWTINSGGKTNIPSFTLVVTGGNIYIDPNVTELDGTYVAEADSSGNGGKIYTCGDDYGAGVFEPMPTASMYNNCNKQLTVDGSLVADQVDLMRTMGSLKDATSSEGPNSAARACLNSSVNSPVCAAEVIESGPEEYLSTPATAPPNEGTPYYNAITSLPPVL